MLLLVDLLSAVTVQRLRAQLSQLRFIPGASTASGTTALEKQNLQLDSEQAEARAVGQQLVEALLANPELRSAALPRSVRHPLVARYTAGMRYPRHTDQPIMGGATPTRTDFACTIWLSAPHEYAGGELVLELPGGTQEFKGEAGSALLYPACHLHEVREVSQGERLVAVTWLQSLVRDHDVRRILAELDSIAGSLGAQHQATPRLRAAYNQLLRFHADL